MIILAAYRLGGKLGVLCCDLHKEKVLRRAEGIVIREVEVEDGPFDGFCAYCLRDFRKVVGMMECLRKELEGGDPGEAF